MHALLPPSVCMCCACVCACVCVSMCVWCVSARVRGCAAQVGVCLPVQTWMHTGWSGGPHAATLLNNIIPVAPVTAASAPVAADRELRTLPTAAAPLSALAVPSSGATGAAAVIPAAVGDAAAAAAAAVWDGAAAAAAGGEAGSEGAALPPSTVEPVLLTTGGPEAAAAEAEAAEAEAREVAAGRRAREGVLAAEALHADPSAFTLDAAFRQLPSARDPPPPTPTKADEGRASLLDVPTEVCVV